MFIVFFKTPIFQASADFSAWFRLPGEQREAFCNSLSVLRSSLFWNVTRRWLVIIYGRFGTACWSSPQGSRTAWLPKMWTINVAEKSVTTNQRCMTFRRREYLTAWPKLETDQNLFFFYFDLEGRMFAAALQPPPWVHTCHEINIACKSLCH